MSQILEAASGVLAEVGYDATTMTAIAERAGASIGAVYQYFPNKEEISRALRSQYATDMRESWNRLEQEVKDASIKELVDKMVHMMVAFINDHPAYLPLLDAPIRYKRDTDARVRLREDFGAILQRRLPDLSKEKGYLIANVALQIVKSMNQLYAESKNTNRQELVEEYKLALAGYLEAHLPG